MDLTSSGKRVKKRLFSEDDSKDSGPRGPVFGFPLWNGVVYKLISLWEYWKVEDPVFSGTGVMK
jgi:hypothetical protein